MNISALSLTFTALGFCLHFSLAATNLLFYGLSLSALGCFVLALWQQPKTTWASTKILWRQPLIISILLWVGFLYLGILYSEANTLLPDYSRKYIKYLLLPLLVWFLATRQNQTANQLVNAFFYGFIAGALLAGVLPWLNVLFNTHLKTQSNGLFAYALLMSTAVLLAFSAWLKQLPYARWLQAALVLIGLAAVIFVSSQRTGLIGLFVGGLVLACCESKHYPKRTLLAAIAVFISVIVLSFSLPNLPMQQRFARFVNEWQTCLPVLQNENTKPQHIKQACDSSTGLRLLFIHDGWLQLQGKPINLNPTDETKPQPISLWHILFGDGLANIKLRTLISENGQRQFSSSHNPHNEYLLQVIQGGLLGISLFLSMLFFALRQALKDKQLGSFYAAVISVYMISSLFNSFFLDALESLYFVLLLLLILYPSVKKSL